MCCVCAHTRGLVGEGGKDGEHCHLVQIGTGTPKSLQKDLSWLMHLWCSWDPACLEEPFIPSPEGKKNVFTFSPTAPDPPT